MPRRARVPSKAWLSGRSARREAARAGAGVRRVQPEWGAQRSTHRRRSLPPDRGARRLSPAVPVAGNACFEPSSAAGGSEPAGSAGGAFSQSRSARSLRSESASPDPPRGEGHRTRLLVDGDGGGAAPPGELEARGDDGRTPLHDHASTHVVAALVQARACGLRSKPITVRIRSRSRCALERWEGVRAPELNDAGQPVGRVWSSRPLGRASRWRRGGSRCARFERPRVCTTTRGWACGRRREVRRPRRRR